MAAPTITSLPDDVLLSILGGLTLQERHTSAVGVCRRWRHLANSSPQLLCVVDTAFGGGNKRAAARLNSLCTWLLTRAARHVQRLSLSAWPALNDAPSGISEQLSAALAATLAGCGMAGSLTALRLEVSTALPFLWLSSLRCLQRLVLISIEERNICWDLPLSGLPALLDLALKGDKIKMPPSAHLPPSLTKLHLEATETDTLPPQVAALTRLHTLSLRWACCNSEGFDVLTALPSLRRLELQDCEHWPSCLAQLTGLQALALDSRQLAVGTDEHAHAVSDVLPLLTRLTSLALIFTPGMEAPPPQLSSLANLHSFFWLSGAGGPLPAGPWLSSLQRLAAVGATVADSAAALAAASRLEFLGVLSTLSDPPLSRSLGAALRAPALRRLVCWARRDAICSNVQVLLCAQQRHASLDIECKAFDVGGPTSDKFWACCGCDADAATSLEGFLAGGA